MEEKAKKRRDYVRTRALALISCGGGSRNRGRFQLRGTIRIVACLETPGDFDAFVTSILSLVLYSVLMFFEIRLFAQAHRKAQAITYVPPIREQIATLPADAVLLRGSDEPVTPPYELLRSAGEGAGKLRRSFCGRNTPANLPV